MNRIILLPLLSLAASGLASTLAAQFPPIPPVQRRGPLSGFPAGISLSKLTRDIEFNGPTAEAVRFKEPLDQTTQPQPWSDATDENTPDYTFATMLEHVPAAQLAGFEFDAIATGNARLPAFDAQGRPCTMSNTWIGLAASVTNESECVSNSLFAARGHSGSDIVSYFFEGSEKLPAGLAGRTQLEMFREDFGLATAADIDGLDFGMGLIQANPGQSESGWLPHRKEFYFSVAKSWVFAVAHPNSTSPLLFALEPGGTNMVPPDAAAIYVSYWQWGSSGSYEWSTPRAWRTREELGLRPLSVNDPLSWDEDVDALSLNPELGVVVYSTQPVLGRNQINVCMLGVGTLMPMKDITNILISDRIGIRIGTGIGPQDDVDALCIEDPEVFAHQVGRVAATPRDSVGLALGWQVDPMSMSLVTSRTVVAGLTTHVTLLGEFCGWSREPIPPSGQATFCALLLTLDDPVYPTGLLLPGSGTMWQIGQFDRFAGQDCVPFSLQVDVTDPNAYGGEFKVEAFQLGATPMTVSWAAHATF